MFRNLVVPPKIKSVAEEDNSHGCSYGDRERLKHGDIDGTSQVQGPRMDRIVYATVEDTLHIKIDTMKRGNEGNIHENYTFFTTYRT